MHHHYATIQGLIEARLKALPSPLPALCLPSFQSLASREFSQIAALLPYMLNDQLPVSEAQLLGLGQAGLLAWWYGHLYDDLLDGEGVIHTPVLAQIALTEALEAYRTLVLAPTPAWRELHNSLAVSAAAHAREVQSRFTTLSELDAAQLALWDQQLLIERAAPFLFMVLAQAQLAGFPLAGAPTSDLVAMLSDLVVARQIGDDAGDWIDDLKHGRLNYVAVQMISSYQRERPGTPLEFDRLAGYQASAEDCWAAFATEHEARCAAALARLAEDASLYTLVQAQQQRGRKVFAALEQQRAAVRQLAGLGS
jgi:hypothetical protein